MSIEAANLRKWLGDVCCEGFFIVVDIVKNEPPRLRWIARHVEAPAARFPLNGGFRVGGYQVAKSDNKDKASGASQRARQAAARFLPSAVLARWRLWIWMLTETTGLSTRATAPRSFMSRGVLSAFSIRDGLQLQLRCTCEHKFARSPNARSRECSGQSLRAANVPFGRKARLQRSPQEGPEFAPKPPFDSIASTK
jgi:hypothetical protein